MSRNIGARVPNDVKKRAVTFWGTENPPWTVKEVAEKFKMDYRTLQVAIDTYVETGDVVLPPTDAKLGRKTYFNDYHRQVCSKELANRY